MPYDNRKQNVYPPAVSAPSYGEAGWHTSTYSYQSPTPNCKFELEASCDFICITVISRADVDNIF
jgi:hypothetical protein